ncbi:hypothetical protein [Demequina sp. NBRC 110055]|uniref:hypothetical protein n=1 Tax=Demequina sp. NBRC 110055 TaxID=1570344 RepID=UPI000A06869A|nr:hypothetical protein [Demequina sp. NBRC 110055]
MVSIETPAPAAGPQIPVTGVRGRRFVLDLAAAVSDDVWRTLFDLELAIDRGLPRTDVTHHAREVARALTDAPIPHSSTDLLVPLHRSIQHAVYWGPASVEDKASTIQDLRAATVTYADRLARAGLVQELLSPGPVEVILRTEDTQAHAPANVQAALEEWRSPARARRRVFRLKPRAASLGTWWVVPPQLPRTTRLWPGHTPAALYSREDDRGELEATSVSIDDRPARVLEIRAAHDWLGLVDRYPLDGTRRVGKCWDIAFEMSSRWMVPDWSAAAQEWDAVHLPLQSYLSFGAMPLPLSSENTTAIAGFDADTTVWLNGSPTGRGAATGWRREDGDSPWRPAATE